MTTPGGGAGNGVSPNGDTTFTGFKQFIQTQALPSHHAITAYLQGDTQQTPQVALNVVSDNTADSAAYFTGKATGRGVIKATHLKPTGAAGNDANAAALSLDMQGAGTACQGIFVTSTTGGTTGNLMMLRNGNPTNNDLLAVDQYGQLILDNDGFGMPVPGAGVKIASNSRTGREAFVVNDERSVPIVHESVPQDHGLLGWTYDAAVANNTFTPVSGTIYTNRVRVPRGTVISNVLLYCSGGASVGLTSGYVAVWDLAGNLLGVSANQAAVNAGLVSIPLTAPTVATPQGAVIVGFLFAGTTPPTLVRCSGIGVVNVNLPASGFSIRFGAAGTGQANMPSPLVAGNIGQSALSWWVGVS